MYFSSIVCHSIPQPYLNVNYFLSLAFSFEFSLKCPCGQVALCVCLSVFNAELLAEDYTLHHTMWSSCSYANLGWKHLEAPGRQGGGGWLWPVVQKDIRGPDLIRGEAQVLHAWVVFWVPGQVGVCPVLWGHYITTTRIHIRGPSNEYWICSKTCLGVYCNQLELLVTAQRTMDNTKYDQ